MIPCYASQQQLRGSTHPKSWTDPMNQIDQLIVSIGLSGGGGCYTAFGFPVDVDWWGQKRRGVGALIDAPFGASFKRLAIQTALPDEHRSNRARAFDPGRPHLARGKTSPLTPTVCRHALQQTKGHRDTSRSSK
jgi:hypothetical protein